VNLHKRQKILENPVREKIKKNSGKKIRNFFRKEYFQKISGDIQIIHGAICFIIPVFIRGQYQGFFHQLFLQIANNP
jgi:hypothetical protein